MYIPALLAYGHCPCPFPPSPCISLLGKPIHLWMALDQTLRIIGPVASGRHHNLGGLYATDIRTIWKGAVALKVRNTLLDISLLKTLIGTHILEDTTGRFQSVVRCVDGKNVLVLKVAVARPHSMLNWEAGSIATGEVEVVDYGRFVLRPGTGKLEI